MHEIKYIFHLYEYLQLWIPSTMDTFNYGYLQLWIPSTMDTFNYGYLQLWIPSTMDTFNKNTLTKLVEANDELLYTVTVLYLMFLMN